MPELIPGIKSKNKTRKKKPILNREISWLSFNGRVLQEAEDPSVPLIERIKFLGIFSSNQDEFFSIRVAALKKLIKSKGLVSQFEINPKDVLDVILDKVLEQQVRFQKIYGSLLLELEKENINLIDEFEVKPEQAVIIRDYFQAHILPTLVPIIIDDIKHFPYLKDRSIYLAIQLSMNDDSKKHKHAIIQIPTAIHSRFVEIPSSDEKKYIMLLEDVIRFCLHDVFYMFAYDHIKAWTIKLSRDAELKLDNDYSGNLIEKVSQSLKRRKKGEPSRFVYDSEIPPAFLEMLVKRIHLGKEDLIPGGRYHNFRDFVKFPKVGADKLSYAPHEAIEHPFLNLRQSIIKTIQQQDCMLHLPYHRYDYVIHFIREAAIDPKVKSIKITLYRVAENSSICNALINAVRNGKAVTVMLELTARFDEESNIYWARKLEEEGATVIYGIQGIKIHSKMCLLGREEKGKLVYYANLGTGNYNENSAKTYCDHSLFTSNTRITGEMQKVFSYIEGKKTPTGFKNLIVSPFAAREKFIALIDAEIALAQKKRFAHIIIKLNHIVDKVLIERLYDAARAGVKVDVIARTTCTMLPVHPNINIISIVDRFLEHARIFFFHNGGKSKFYLSSSDWMTRNLDHRLEVTFPVYDKELQSQLKKIIDIQLQDNTKARIIDGQQRNKYVNRKGPAIRSQYSIYNMLLSGNMM